MKFDVAEPQSLIFLPHSLHTAVRLLALYCLCEGIVSIHYDSHARDVTLAFTSSSEPEIMQKDE